MCILLPIESPVRLLWTAEPHDELAMCDSSSLLVLSLVLLTEISSSYLIYLI